MSGLSDMGRSLTTRPSVNWGPPISPKCSESANPSAPTAKQAERGPGDDLNRPMPTEPPYLVT